MGVREGTTGIWTEKGVPFICDKCKNGTHHECPGETWCDCQHGTPRA
jgi:hypothetical protein